jgi:hypothetical protein
MLADEKEEVFEVEQVLKHRYTGTRTQYLIHWKGYPLHEATWEPEINFQYHRDAIETYERIELNFTAPDRMDATERQRCRDNNLCFRCRKGGHRSVNCPEFKSNSAAYRLSPSTDISKKYQAH